MVFYGLGHWLSLPLENKPFEGRDYICLVHACITIPKNTWYILGNSINICWMNKKEARRMHSQESETELALWTASVILHVAPTREFHLQGHDRETVAA